AGPGAHRAAGAVRGRRGRAGLARRTALAAARGVRGRAGRGRISGVNTHPTTTGPDSPAAATPPGAPLDLALIGHTNTGKTSVLRSLLRDRNVGEVADEAGTTRTSTRYEMTVAGRVAAYLWDTPGLEDAGPLLR